MRIGPGGRVTARRLLAITRGLELADIPLAFQRLFEVERKRQARISELRSVPPQRVLFVCQGNIMRSAFAEAYARNRFWKEVVLSAGTHASSGAHADSNALEAASRLGVDLAGHRSRRLDELTPTGSDLVLCMDRRNEVRAVRWAGKYARRVLLLGDIQAVGSEGPAPSGRDVSSVEVADPYGHGSAVAQSAFERIAHLLDAWHRYLERVGQPPMRARAE